jgi:hypothetical protein
MGLRPKNGQFEFLKNISTARLAGPRLHATGAMILKSTSDFNIFQGKLMIEPNFPKPQRTQRATEIKIK